MSIMTDTTHYHAVETTHDGDTTEHRSTTISQGPNKSKFDFGYVKSREGILNVVEIVSLKVLV